MKNLVRNEYYELYDIFFICSKKTKKQNISHLYIYTHCFRFLFLKCLVKLLVICSRRAITKAKGRRMNLTAFKISIFVNKTDNLRMSQLFSPFRLHTVNRLKCFLIPSQNFRNTFHSNLLLQDYVSLKGTLLQCYLLEAQSAIED